MSDSLLSQLPLDLGEGLVLRFATWEDYPAWAEFNRRIREDPGSAERIGRWGRDLMCGTHPTTKASDFTLVEDTRTGQIVSATCLISQTWAYGGIPFGVGRPEHVATLPEYRRRGLVRRQMEVLHALSASRGELMLAVTGIPWYYRQFGYEYALDLGHGRSVYLGAEPRLREGAPQFCRLRPVTPADHAFIRQVYEQAATRQPFTVVRSPEHWAYEFSGRSAGSEVAKEWWIIESLSGQPLGYVHSHARLGAPRLVVRQVELRPGVSFLNVALDLLRALSGRAQELIAAGGQGTSEVHSIYFLLGREHPLYAALPPTLTYTSKGYAWYIRIPDLLAFLRHLRPALEKNLEGTPAESYSGSLTLSFYRSGLAFQFEQGRITALLPWQPGEPGAGDACFPELTFLQVLCGRRTYAELAEVFPDCRATFTAETLLNALFPQFTGNLWHVE